MGDAQSTCPDRTKGDGADLGETSNFLLLEFIMAANEPEEEFHEYTPRYREDTPEYVSILDELGGLTLAFLLHKEPATS